MPDEMKSIYDLEPFEVTKIDYTCSARLVLGGWIFYGTHPQNGTPLAPVFVPYNEDLKEACSKRGPA